MINRKDLPQKIKDICGKCSEFYCPYWEIGRSTKVESINLRLNIPAEKKRADRVLTKCAIFKSQAGDIS